MKLEYVQIKNFRSIQDIKVEFEPTCRVLVGINESGKSNIINALALLSKEREPVKKDDLREALPDEKEINESFIRFVFKFEKKESDKLYEAVSAKIFSGLKNPDIILSGETRMSIREFCSTRTKGLYNVDIIAENKFFTAWSLNSNYKLLAGWKKPTATCPKNFTFNHNSQKFILSLFKLVKITDLESIPNEYLEDASIDDLSALSLDTIREITEENLPDTIFWEYDEKNLLPNSVLISDFSSDPESCVPLKNMFNLADITDIATSINKAKIGTENQFQNYLNRIAKKTTNHFRTVWKEYKNIEFSLKLNADQIIPGIKEKNTLDFARRSDGFKRFVTFLLMISVNVKINKLSNSLLLIDEPDTSLHPSGARYLRDELIRISKKNHVVYSTHSIFMIDSGDISRHYIVKKKDEITRIESAKASNIADEEVLYNALGYSIFAILKEKNIIFEGWKDKRLFCIAIEYATSTLKQKYSNIGICHAKGAKSIKAITPMIELAKRKCLIISDSDRPAKEQQKIYQSEKGFGEWKTYQDINPKISAITGEDFIKNDFIAHQVRKVLLETNLPSFNQAILPTKKGKLDAIVNWLTENGMTPDQAKDTKTEIKNLIFEELKYQHIEDNYNELLKSITI